MRCDRVFRWCAVIGAVCLSVAGASALAQDASDSDRQAPAYFVEAVFNTTTAQAIAQACPDLSFHIQAASIHSGAVMAQLEEEGYDITPGLTMPGFDPQIQVLQEEFLTRTGLREDGSSENACGAGMAEIEAQSGIGQFLEVIPE